jgi:hypothetical protein
MLTALLLSLVTFTSAAVGDVVEAYFVRACVDLRPHAAARMSVAMYVVSCIGWIVTVKVSLWYCIPEVLGLYAGSVLAVRTQALAKARERAQATERCARLPEASSSR